MEYEVVKKVNKIKNKDTRKLIRKMKAEGWSNRAIGRELGIPETTIRDYINGRTWSGEGKLQYDPEDVALSKINYIPRPFLEGKEGTNEYDMYQIYKRTMESFHKNVESGIMVQEIYKPVVDNSRILLISDLHIPYHHPDALDFLQHLKDKYNPTRVICMGDELDKHALSFHDSDPDLPSAGDELRMSLPVIAKLKEMFPVMDILESNHGSLLYRKAHAFGIPKHYLKSYNDVLGVDENWKWYYDITLDLPNGNKCYLHHGKSSNVTKTSQTMSMCSAAGHFHETFKIEYWGNPVALYWAMQTGCLIDDKSYAFNYNNVNLKRPIIGTGLIIDSMPILEPMVLDSEGRWVLR